MRIFVRDNNVDQALRILKKKMQREGLLRELRAREAYEKPSEKRVREMAEAVRGRGSWLARSCSVKGSCPCPSRSRRSLRGRVRSRQRPRISLLSRQQSRIVGPGPAGRGKCPPA